MSPEQTAEEHRLTVEHQLNQLSAWVRVWRNAEDFGRLSAEPMIAARIEQHVIDALSEMAILRCHRIERIVIEKQAP